MNNFHFRKIKQLKDWEKDLSAVLTFKSNEMDEETRNDTIRYRGLLIYAIEQAERAQELKTKNKRYREAIANIKQTSKDFRNGHLLDIQDSYFVDEIIAIINKLEGEE